ncbi:FtsX-like permease family protein [Amycolatopsis benzoatilytica]|uniref:FtsX-like permease family protein n=1 Tax=Amycolatopsis benzoatilytica TaxID=346045 RepID=UPI000A052A10|nr:FtsX-like permease family protein [Amycolatopsis benzoatilytica]
MRAWGATPWTRAPRTGWRQPAVVVAAIAAAVLVALPAAAVALFLSSAGNATLSDQMDRACQWSVGAQWSGGLAMTSSAPAMPGAPPTPVGKPLEDARIAAARQYAHGVPRLSDVQSTLLATAKVDPVKPGDAHPEQSALWLVSQDGFQQHLQTLEGGKGPGIWLSSQFAAARGLHAGDQVVVHGGWAPRTGAPPDGPVRTIPVAAVYRDLRELPDRPYWCHLQPLYRPSPLTERPVYPLAFVSRADLFGLTPPDGGLSSYLEASVDRDGLTTADAPAVVAGLDRVRARTAASPLFQQNARMEFSSSLGGIADRADQVVSSLAATVVPIGVAGSLTGLVISVTVGSFWVERRRAELAVLSARGAGPAALAGKALLELGSIALAGSIGGWFAARGLVSALGPSPLVTPGALGFSVLGAAVSFLATLAGIGGSVVLRTRALFDARTSRIRHLPWEILPLVAAAVCYFALGDGVQAGVGQAGSVARIPPRLIVVPLLLVLGLAMLATRLVRLFLPRIRAVRRERAVAFLAWRRLASAPSAAAVLVGATAVPVALSIFATMVTGSVERTLGDEGQLVVGSDVVVRLTGPARVPPSLAGQATLVDRYDSAFLGSKTVNVVGADPATFGSAAFWDDDFRGPALPDLLARMSGEGAVGLLAGVPEASEHTTLSLAGQQLPLTVVTVAQLPGKSAGFPELVLRKDILAKFAGENVHHELWVRGDPAEVLPELGKAGVPAGTVSRATDVTAHGVYGGITYTFAFLTAVSALVGAVVLVGLLLYLNARSRARRGAYVLLRRMGISSGAHWRALAYEVGGLLAAGFALGLGFAAVGVSVTYQGYDLDPETPPDTVLPIPWWPSGRLLLAAAAVALLVTYAAQRAAARALPSEVLRDTV